MTPGRDVRSLCLAASLAAAALAPGCLPPPPRPARPNVLTDPCAERLHNLCGNLLLYYSAHKKLPPALEDLISAGSFSRSPAVCPVSNRPYVYDPAGLPLPKRRGRLVLYDPLPSHAKMRWGILVGPPAPGGLITANVVLVSEEELTAARE